MKKHQIKTKAIFQEGKSMNRLSKLSVAIKKAFALSSLLIATSVQATPELLDGGRLDGSSISNGGIIDGFNTTVVNQVDQVSYIDWLTYNLGANEAINYIQPNTQSVSINTISEVGGESIILGQINANGHVYLINPAGITFGSGAQVNVGGLVVSTLSLDQYDVDQSTASFVNGSGAAGVVNQGSLTGANGVTLIGNYINNEGTITTTGAAANLNLIAADQVTLSFDSDGLIQFEVDDESGLTEEFNEDIDTAITNAGTLESSNVFVAVDALNDVYASAVNHTGFVSATTFDVNASGNVVLRTGTNISERNKFDVEETINVRGATVDVDRLLTDEGENSSITVEAKAGDLAVNSLIANTVSITATGDISQIDNAGVRADSASFSGQNVTLNNLRSVSNSLTITASEQLSLGEQSLNTGSEGEINLQSLKLEGDTLQLGFNSFVLGNQEGVDTVLSLKSGAEGSDFEFNNLSADSITIDSAGDVTQLEGSQIATDNLSIKAGGALTISQDLAVANSISLEGNTLSFGQLNTTRREAEGDIASNIVLKSGDSGVISLSGLVADNINITGGAVTQQAETIIEANSLTVSGASSVVLTDLSRLTDSIAIDSAGVVSITSDQLSVQSSIDISGLSLALNNLETTSETGSVKLTSSGSEALVLNNISTADLQIDTNGALAQAASTRLSTDTLAVTASEITLSDITAFEGAGSLSNATLRATANQGGAVIVSTNLVASGDITLEGNTVTTADLTANSGTISIKTNGAESFNLTDSVGDLTADSLVLNAQGDLVQGTRALNLNNLTTTSGGSITLDANGNQVDNLTLNSGTNVVVQNETAINLNNIEAGGNLVVTSGGSITQLQDTTLTANSLSMTANGNGSDIALTSAINVSGNIELTAANISAVGLNSSSGSQISVTTRDVKENGEDFSILGDLGSVTAGSLVLDIQGNIIQGTAGLALSFADITSSGTVTLNNENNQIGDLALKATSAEINVVNGLNLEDVTVNSLVLMTGGNITQSQEATISAGNLELIASSEGTINLVNADNTISNLTLTASGASINSGSALTVGSINVGESGSLTLNSGGNIIQAEGSAINAGIAAITAAGSISQLQGAMIDANSVNLSANGNISQSDNAILSANSLVITASDGGSIVLTNANNIESLALEASSAQVNSTNTLILNTVNVGESGGLVLTSDGSITQSQGTSITAQDLTLTAAENFTQQVNTSLIATSADINAAGMVTLLSANLLQDSSINSTGNMTIGTINTNGAALNLTSGDDIVQAEGTNISTGSVVFNSGGGFVQSQNATINANLINLTANGNITQEQGGTVDTDSLVLTANGGGVIAFDNNNAIASLTIEAGGASINSIENLNINSVNVETGELTLTSSGNISQSSESVITAGSVVFESGGAITQSQNGVINADSINLSANGSITQGEGATLNTSSLIVSANSGGLIILDNSNSISSLSIVGSGASVNSITDLNVSDVNVGSGNLTLNSDGSISQLSENTITAGSVALTAGQGGNITLNTALAVTGDISLTGDNVFTEGLRASESNSTISVISRQSSGDDSVFNLTDDLGRIEAGNLVLDIADSIEQGSSSLNVNSADVTSSGTVNLGHEDNNIGELTLSATGAQINSGSSININNINLSNEGDFILTSGGNVSQSEGTNLLANTASITAGGSVTLLSANLQQNSSVNSTGNMTIGNVTTNGAALNLMSGGSFSQSEGSTIAAGALQLTSAGDISQSGGSTLNAESIALSASGNFIQAQGASLTANSAIIEAGGTVTLISANLQQDSSVNSTDNMTIGNVTTNGNALNLTSGGSITQSENSVLTAGSLVIFANNDFTQAENSSLVANSAAITVEGDATIRSATLQQDSSVNSTGNMNIGDVTTNGGALNLIATGNITQSEGSAIAAGALQLTSAGGISQSGGSTLNAESIALSASGNFIQTQGASLTANSAIIEAGGTVTLISANLQQDSSVNSTDNMTIGNVITNGNALNLTSGGSITQSENSVVNAGSLVIIANNDFTQAENSSLVANSAAITVEGDATIRSATLQQDSSVNSTGNMTIGNVTTNGNALNLTSGGSFTQSENSVVNAGSLVIFANTDFTQAENSSLVANSAAITVEGDATIRSATLQQDSSVNSTGNMIIGDVTTNGGALNLIAAGNITQSEGSTIAAGNLQLSSAGDIVQSESSTLNADTLGLAAIGSFIQEQGANLTASSAAIDAGGAITLSTATLQQGGTIDSVGSLSIGDISVTDSGSTLVLRASEIKEIDNVQSSITANGSDVSLLSDTTIAVGTINVNSLLLVAASDGSDVDTDTESQQSLGIVQTITVDNTNANNVIVAIGETDPATNITVDLNAGNTETTQIDSGFLVTQTPVPVEFSVAGLTTVATETLTVSGAENFGAQVAQAETASSNVGGDTIGASETIFRTPYPSIKLPVDQVVEDEFDEFSSLLKLKEKGLKRAVGVALPVSK